MSARRIYCAGNCGRWFYYDGARKPGKQRGGGRPVERCPRCRAMHEAARRRDNHRNYVWKRAQLRPLEVA